ncbi:MAG TPA: AMP-binding protein [Gammaproteobacteria bacterium]|nr:AMP-binding protein [Gammaproteobacteria bacterium]
MSAAASENLYACFAAAFPAAGACLLETPDGARWHYGEIETESARLARFLREAGLAPGDRLSAQIEKSVAGLVLYLACLRAGLVFHPLNPAYTAAELEFFLGDAAPAAVVADPARAAEVFALAARAGAQRHYTLDAQGRGSLWEASRTSAAECPIAAVDEHALAALLYSSGTTGKPKGIGLTHRNLAVNARALSAAWGFTREDVLLHALPMFHVHGLFIALGCVLLSGSRMLFLPKFDTEAAIRALPHATAMMGVPTYYTRLLAHPRFDAALCRRVRLFTCGSAPLLPDSFHAFEARTGHRLLERYGMTETSVITSNPLRGDRRPGAVGLPVAGTELRIVDDADRPVAETAIGHVQVRGPSVFGGYWRRPDKTREDFTADGWFRTGDDGFLDADGYLHLVGRGKDLVISGGLNVYPSEVETVLDALPGIRESAVVGLPHPDFGEQVVAVIVAEDEARPEEEAIRAAVRTQLAAYKQPKRYVFVDALPRNAMGKVQKNVLRETLAT